MVWNAASNLRFRRRAPPVEANEVTPQRFYFWLDSLDPGERIHPRARKMEINERATAKIEGN